MENFTNQTAIELPLKIKTYDIDVAGHVNNIVYIQWMEDLRTSLFEQNFNLQKLLFSNVYPIVLSTEFNYKKYLTLFDKPVGTMYVERCTHGIFTLKAEVMHNGRRIAFGTQKCVLFDLAKLEIIKGYRLQELLPEYYAQTVPT